MHYRARQYDPNLGRFISEDPIGFAGGINLYAYVSNSPVNFADPHGYFPSIYPLDYHQRRIGRNALIGIATPWQIEAINWANDDLDMRTQDPIYAPYHAMRRPGQTIDDARGEANDLVRRKICLAREYASRGWNTDAMHELGKAAHTMQDAASPSHAGFQEAWPNTYLSTIVNGWHYIRESVFPGAVNLSAAQENTKKVWSYFQGSSMPNDFFGSQSNSTSCGCER